MPEASHEFCAANCFLYDTAPEQFVIVHMNMAREVCRRLHLAVDLLTETKAQLDSLNAHGLYM